LAVFISRCAGPKPRHEIHTNSSVCNAKGNPRRPSSIYFDVLAGSQAVRITPEGYEITCEHMIDFREVFHEEILPAPAEPADPAAALAKLRSLLNLPDDRAWIRSLMWLLAAFRPAGPYPPLVLNGPAGSGNSTAVCVLRALVDANQLPLRAIPRSASALADLA
jgi:hypothetical protein